MRGTWEVSVYVAVVRLDTILSNSNAATTKKDVQKVRSIVVWPTIKQQKIPEKHTCSLAQTKVFRQCKPEVPANPRKGMKKNRETRGRGARAVVWNDKKNRQKESCTQRRRGAVFYFSKSIQKSCFEPRERSVAVFFSRALSLINISLYK